MDTIYALSSGAPPAAIAVLRISGPDAGAAFPALGLTTRPTPRRATLATLRRGGSAGEVLDRAILLWFAGPATVTGEDLLELHLHGGRAVIRAVEAELARLPGFRLAEPGEFTRRALTAGRIDLTEAEGLADLLAAETEGQRRAAQRMSEGALRQRVEQWTDRLLTLAAMIEALLDHGDEGDVLAERDLIDGVRSGAAELADAIAPVLAQPPVERLRDGVRVVLAGPPNAGKSTLLNALAEREAAIVSPIAGTTRDRIEAQLVRNGIAYVLTDTAGLVTATADPIEAIGVARARDAMASADILLWLDDAPPPASSSEVIAVHPRSDMPDRQGPTRDGRLVLSARTGEGIGALWARIEQVARRLLPAPDIVALNHRQRGLLSEVELALRSAVAQDDPVLIAEDLRAARVAFDRMTGRASVESMLDSLFGRFCIGK
ncbi:tRNA uridine-5-carboxymethylaminomethyl(34) synthesis GTPase MnmE [Sphingomonas sp. SFZ2018-12]|uniref:tRNA uridine-5-carboxymethylaminomethyl(34) synthesis GTPase MnmE n=1 Tax=Sphingomonas sp. SFZ2018-12 TaxID=2683197 RepID=UPI001F1000A0|nr:tRNA uridine-5-carboxymethylaminomethyl(34) synthesis GTPase MnmE [Sphingomonas sp. SFZ2018-12]MCH4893613.1 tRNA uridine-5-carboxymethylaminomethyl(34) synthesis GTPase MnmE [Sphingomonas sp. SFZ2018-12]